VHDNPNPNLTWCFMCGVVVIVVM